MDNAFLDCRLYFFVSFFLTHTTSTEDREATRSNRLGCATHSNSSMSTAQSDSSRLLLAPSSLKNDFDDALVLPDDDFSPPQMTSSLSGEDGADTLPPHADAGAVQTPARGSGAALAQQQQRAGDMRRVNSVATCETGSTRSADASSSRHHARDVITVPFTNMSAKACRDLMSAGLGAVVLVTLDSSKVPAASSIGSDTSMYTISLDTGKAQMPQQQPQQGSSDDGRRRAASSASSLCRSIASSSAAPCVGLICEDPDAMKAVFSVRLTGVCLARVQCDARGRLEVGTWLVPSGKGNGTAVKGTASHPLALGTAVEARQAQLGSGHAGGTSLVLVKLTGSKQANSSSTTPRVRSAPHYGTGGINFNVSEDDSDGEPARVDDVYDNGSSDLGKLSVENKSRTRQNLLFLLCLVLCLIAGSVAVVLKFLPKKQDHSDVFQFECNETKALSCTQDNGEFENQCHAYYLGSSPAVERCCRSVVAHACYTGAFCYLPCPTGTSELSLNLHAPHKFTLATFSTALQKVLQVTASVFKVVHYSQNTSAISVVNPTASVELISRDPGQRSTFINSFWLNLADKPQRETLGLSGMPWMSQGTPRCANLIGSSAWEWTNGTDFQQDLACKVTAGQQIFATPCITVSGGLAASKQRLDLQYFPFQVFLVFSGYLSLVVPDGQTVSGRSDPLITLTFRGVNGSTELLTVKPGFFSPLATNQFYPQYIPFFWAGWKPFSADYVDIEIGCAGYGANTCKASFGGLTLAPAEDRCSGVHNCDPLRCVPSNKSHALCLSTDVVRSPPPNPYLTGGDTTGLNKYFAGLLVDKTTQLVQCLFRGIMDNVEVTLPPAIVVLDKLTRKPVPDACNGTMCVLEPNLPQGHFSYNFRITRNMSALNRDVRMWIVSSVDSSADASFSVDLSWYAARDAEPALNIL